jgi:hypothetical protein
MKRLLIAFRQNPAIEPVIDRVIEQVELEETGLETESINLLLSEFPKIHKLADDQPTI